MICLGGKARIAAKLTAAIRAEVGSAPCWEPFCGGANMTTALAAGGPGVAGDIHAPLIAMYRAVQAGWSPPEQVSKATYDHAKMLPDTDPLKAFCGFGLSWGGKWFAGYVGDRNRIVVARTGVVSRHRHRPAAALARSLRQLPRHWRFECQSFFDRKPQPINAFVYCDPPYSGVTPYSTGPFGHGVFWRQCQQWARHTRVFVSEYMCPVPHRLVIAIPRSRVMTGTAATARGAPVERLFEVEPAARRGRR